MTDPAWLARARLELGVAETQGPGNTTEVLHYFAAAGHPEVSSDAIAWCAAFAGACLEWSGVRSTKSLRARSYLDWGEPLTEPREGAITILKRGDDPALGHVGFFLKAEADNILLLAGNQGDAVSIAAFPAERVLGYRWPIAAVEIPVFDQALAHVLEMEGGWSHDPADPGGATNFGITLNTFAAYRREPVSTQLIDALQHIDQTTVRAIYEANYWRAAHCDELPAAIALMHFDAAVNHGPARAAKFLQAALGVTEDGEIGPETLGAAESADAQSVLAGYAELRRGFYRALPTFPHFGRGWLARVDKTFARALALAENPAYNPPKETNSMPNEQKWWGSSVTIWGVLITVLTTVLPAAGPLIGLDINPAMIKGLGGDLTQLVQALGGIIGTGVTVFGRFRASKQLQQKQIKFHL